MEFFNAGSNHGSLFGQFRQVLFASQKAFIPVNLAL